MSQSSVSWDRNNDGKIDRNEILGLFDSNNDGVLDANELDRLAVQLTNQLDFNNQLLQQIKRMEEAQLITQRDTQTNQESYFKLMQSNNDLKKEFNDTKRKLKVSQEIIESLTKQLKEAKTEASTSRHELDLVTNLSDELRVTIRDTTDDKVLYLRNHIHFCNWSKRDFKIPKVSSRNCLPAISNSTC